MFGETGMGLKAALVATVVLLAIGYIALNGGEINIDFSTNKAANTWTAGNFTQAAGDPMSHKGDKVDLKLLVFNKLDISGLKGYEAYLGTLQQLQQNPMDPTRRVYVSYDPSKLPEPIEPGNCIHVTGQIQGVAHITTQDNSHINVTYIKSSTIEKVPCSP